MGHRTNYISTTSRLLDWRRTEQSCFVPVLAIDAGDELWGAINSATKRGRRDGDERRPRHRLFGLGG
jgi:hypothetical protein